MAELRQRAAQYEYRANANLVLQADRSLIDRRSKDEATGEVKSLASHMTGTRMGDKAMRGASTELEERKKRRAQKETVAAAKKPKATPTAAGGLLLNEQLDLNLKYRPKTQETQHTYELILSYITEFLGSQPQDILMGAADEVLDVLKDESIQMKGKANEIASMLGRKLMDEEFTRLVALGQKITDYQDKSVEEGEDDNLDEEQGVALIFDRDDEDEAADGADGLQDRDEDDDLDVVREEEVDEDAEPAGGEETIVRANLGDIGKQAAADQVDPREVDAFWLQRQLGQYSKDAVETQKLAETTLSVLQESKDDRDCENRLVQALGFERFEFVKLLRKNRNVVLYCTLLARASNKVERQTIEAKMRSSDELAPILKRLQESTDDEEKAAAAKARKAAARAERLDADVDAMDTDTVRRPRKIIQLEDVAFAQGGHTMTNKKCKLPPGSTRTQQKGYEEVHVPALKAQQLRDDEKAVLIEDMPEWSRTAFKGFKKLNRVQSRLYPIAFGTDENVLLCAPTGAGKTNVALLTMLRELEKSRNPDTGTIDLQSFKIIYVAPMKSLVAEMTGSFRKRLAPFNLVVEELTGDQSLTREQIYNTNVIVCTPEKWDVVTRKGGFEGIVSLVIIDEIHLLHDDRGPVLESILARMLRQSESTQVPCRLVGLSATLPNYADVAALLRVDPSKGLFFFDNSFRPCPLQQSYIGITERKPLKRFQLMNDIVYEKVMACAGKQQVLIFTHSRKDTAKTAHMLREMCTERDTIGQFMREDSASVEILRELVSGADQIKDNDLRELLPYGFAIHHAGMSRADRTVVEDLFGDRHIQVLVSTATLAWGVNLPAHTVIIKGTQVYSAEKGGWTELSFMDVMQMLGRAGRPQYDEFGEGIVITTHSELQYYLSLLNEQLPVESQYISKLSDNLNAEIVSGTVQSVQEAVKWLGYTYLYIRMLRNPALYGVPPEAVEDDPKLEQYRADLIHSAAMILEKSNLIKYDKKTGVFQSTDLGRIASHFYCTCETINTFNSLLKPSLTEIELLRIFSRATEFKFVRVRNEEKLELQTLMENVPIPIKESIDESSAKINVLLQAYISQLKLDGFALMADMVFITQSADRLFRAMFEIVMRRGWAQLTERVLTLCKMVDRRMWQSMSPLRQFKNLNMKVILSLEKKELMWDQLHDLSHTALGEMIRQPKLGKTLHKYIHLLPRVELSAHVQPITRNTLKIMLTITPDFPWDESVHGNMQSFWVFVEDCDGEEILHSEFFGLKQRFATQDHVLDFFVPIGEPMPPQYFIRVVSDRWLGSETILPVSFRHLILPEKFPMCTELLDLQPLPISALSNKIYERLYTPRFKFFNAVQTQVFSALYNSSDSVLVSAPVGSGKTVCAELALLRAYASDPKSTCVYLAPKQEIIDAVAGPWRELFGSHLSRTVVTLTGDVTADVKLAQRAHLILATAEQWDAVSRRWKSRPFVQNISLLVFDELHLMGGANGPTLEVVLSRMRFMSTELQNNLRIVALSASVANAKEMGAWLGISSANVFNFHPNVRPVPLDLHIQGFRNTNANARLISMARPTYSAIKQYSPSKPVIVFVPSRRQAQVAAVELVSFVASDDDGPRRFLHCEETDLAEHLSRLQDESLKEVLASGVGFYHEGLRETERRVVEHLFSSGAVQVLVVAREMAWALPVAAYLVVIQDTQYYDGKDHRYVDYPVPDILQMIGRANRPLIDDGSRCVLMCQSSRKAVYTKFLFEPLPVESHLDHVLHDHFNAEVVAKTIQNQQDAVDYLTWTFLYRRLTQNPNYYNLHRVQHRDISEHLSELVETTLADLVESKCIAVDTEADTVEALNLGVIASYYHINYTTIELFSRSLTNKTRLKGLLEIICAATEFEEVPMRYREEAVLARLATRLPIKLKENAYFNDPHVKANLLLQAHFSRLALPSDLQSDQEMILKLMPRLVAACVDVLSSSSWLEPALAAMELSQMVTQAVWSTDPLLRQLPHVSAEVLKRAKEKAVESIFDLTDLEDEDRNNVLQMSEQQLADVARFCNRYPNIALDYAVDGDNATTDEPVSVTVSLDRDEDQPDDAMVGPVIAPFFPHRKDESWWLVVGQPGKNHLAAIKKVVLQQRTKVNLAFEPTSSGQQEFKLYLMCDSYMGCDQEYVFTLNVQRGEGEEDDEMGAADEPEAAARQGQQQGGRDASEEPTKMDEDSDDGGESSA